MKQQQRGFSNLEFFSVICIISVILAILIPVFSQAREKARGMSCLSKRSTLARGMMMYVQDYDERFPMTANLNIPNYAITARHQDLCTVSFADGHVKLTRKEDLYPNKNIKWQFRGCDFRK
jgi:prepilin-type processing-associated H-X9-DG protein